MNLIKITLILIISLFIFGCGSDSKSNEQQTTNKIQKVEEKPTANKQTNSDVQEKISKEQQIINKSLNFSKEFDKNIIETNIVNIFDEKDYPKVTVTNEGGAKIYVEYQCHYSPSDRDKTRNEALQLIQKIININSDYKISKIEVKPHLGRRPELTMYFDVSNGFIVSDNSMNSGKNTKINP